MVFSSLTFLFLFLPIVLLLCAISRKTSYQNTLLFFASLLFYAWGGVGYTLILLISIILNFLFGIRIEKSSTHRKGWLVVAIILNLSSLAFFKYANFLVDNFNILTGIFGISAITLKKIVLPIGISFYTFQGISYLVDVYREDVQAQHNFIKLGTYIALFPQLIAGPIIRYNTIYSQLDQRKFSLDNLYEGITRFCFGLARKVLIANQLAIIADDIFSRAPDALSPLAAWIGAICYALQIYHDFAGYSDMAIGLGRMLGFSFPENFNLPYISKSIREFWRRWHITLSAWFKDYLYIPLGGNRRGKWRTYLNLYIVFFLTGLWHGSSWNFVVWGLLHGTFIVLERVGFDKLLEKIFRPLQHLYTLFVVVIAWVFFRADNLAYAAHYIQHMFCFSSSTPSNIFLTHYLQPSYIVVLIIAILGSTSLLSRFNEKWKAGAQQTMALSHIRQICIILGILLTLLSVCCFLTVGGYNPFIYFRF